MASSGQGELQRTPLFEVYGKARTVPFSGWEMPVQFSGITAEHQAVRDRVGMFDISHMGKFQLLGSEILVALQTLVPSDLTSLVPGQARYTVLLNADGGIMDDLIVYVQEPTPSGQDQVFLIVNAATTTKDKQYLIQHLDGTEITLADRSQTDVLIAVQGPEAIATVQAFTDAKLSNIGRYHHATVPLMGSTAFVARTGYTGEDGFEIMLDAAAGQNLWRSLLEAGVTPCGLGARDTLRLEAAMALYGQDVDEQTTPLEAGLGWLVQLDQTGDFMGRSRLEAQKRDGLTRRLVGLTLTGRNIARHGYSVLHDGVVVGEVTSGTLAPTVGCPIALAYVPPQLAKPGQTLTVDIRGRQSEATVVKRPFYKRSSK
jgi:aminomethyltransferase